MSKTLKVIKPFFVMEEGDTFELSQDGKEYTSSFNMERHESDDENTITSKYSSNYTISPEYAKLLLTEGYLIEVKPDDNKLKSIDKPYLNVFTEIDNLLATYKEELENIDDDMADMPACMKIEKETVLQNLISTLNHLNSLKK